MKDDATSLDRLHDLVAPPPVPWWPPAPGWWWLGGVALLALAVWAINALIRWQHNRYRREALAEWHRHHARLQQDGEDRVEVLHQLAVLLKRTALTVFPRQQVASLTGKDWHEFLERHSPVRGFVDGPGELLEAAAYRLPHAANADAEQVEAAAALVRDWIRLHQVPRT